MPTLAIEIPEEAAAILEAGTLEADATEVSSLIPWNVQLRAERLRTWAESADRPPDELRRLVDEPDTLARAFEAL